jgi:glucosamine-6-phosphate deaminase
MPQISIEPTHSEICKKAAQHIAQAIQDKPTLVLGLATGNTMEPLYAELVRMHNKEGLDFSQVKFFNLDEYKGVGAEDPRSFNHYLHTLFLDQVNAKPENIHLVQGKNFDPAAYEQSIKDA